jgi:myo-inositol 2-dehydrogenase/D-chiro-inositol 1-dehydrogenase
MRELPRCHAAAKAQPRAQRTPGAREAAGSIHSRPRAFGCDRWLEIFGLTGMAPTSNNFPDNVTNREPGAVSPGPAVVFLPGPRHRIPCSDQEEFIPGIVEEREPLVTWLDRKMPVPVAKAARLSHDLHRPVKVAEIK